MDDRVVQFRVGVTVLAAVIITGILMLLFHEGPSLLSGTYTVYVKFRSAPGVSRDTPIEKSGIRIGKVTKVQFAPDSEVLVTASIDGAVELFRDEVVQIKQSLLGDARLEFVPGPQSVAQRVKIQPGDMLAGAVSVDPLQAFANIEGNLSRAADSLADAGSEVGKLAKNINDVLGNNREQLARIITDTDQTMLAFQRTLKNIDDVTGDEKLKNDLKQTIAGMPTLLGDTRDTIIGMQKTLALANDNLRNMQTVTKAMDEQGEGMVSNIAQSVERLDELLGQFNKFSRALNSKEGSLGQLVNNPELYNSLSQAAANVNRLTRELEPVVCNVQIITDKVARHPGVVLTDAIAPGPGLK